MGRRFVGMRNQEIGTRGPGLESQQMVGHSSRGGEPPVVRLAIS